MDPQAVVKSFLQGETLLKAVGKGRGLGVYGPPLAALLESAQSGGNLDDALRLAQQVHDEPTDPAFLLLFLIYWGEAALRLDRLEETEALIRRARLTAGTATPPEIRSALLSLEGRLSARRGNHRAMEEALEKSLLDLPPDSLHHPARVGERVLFLARQGRASEAESDLSRLDSLGTEASRRLALLARFVNAVETGRAGEAELMGSRIEEELSSEEWNAADYPFYRLLLDLMGGRGWEEKVPVPDPSDPSPVDLRQWAMVVRRLLDRQPAEALRFAHHCVRGDPVRAAAPGFISCALLRAELSAGRLEAARKLLETRRERAPHYLDDFFACRVALLAGDRNLAAEQFASVLRAVEDYGAEGRLDLEIRLSCELSTPDLLRLGRAAREMGGVVPLGAPPRAERLAGAALLGKSPAMAFIRDAIARFAELDVPVLVTGETGTGKELVARAVHEGGARRAEPFIAVNCAAIPETLLESELFGHVRGAFTGAEAHRGFFETAGSGTLFLDEIGDISPRLQAALLRVLETGEIRPVGSEKTRRISCRIVAATNAPLDRLAEESRFRKDLLFRLRRLEIAIPPLRRRPEDILLLGGQFLDQDRKPGQRAVLSDDLKEALRRCPWPGNVRELKNEIERMRLMNPDQTMFTLYHLHARYREQVMQAAFPGPATADRRPPTADERAPAAEGRPPAAPRPPDPSNPRPPDPATPSPPPTDEVERLLSEGRSFVRRHDRLVALFSRHRKLTRAEIVKILRVSRDTAGRDLKALRAEGLIEKVEPGPSPRTHYFVWKGAPEPLNP